MVTTGASYEVTEIGYHTPKKEKVNVLKAGEVGFLSASIKSIDNVVSEKVSKATIGIKLISSALERGVKKFKKEFLDSFGIEAKLIGEGDDIELYYCDDVNGVFEIA